MCVCVCVCVPLVYNSFFSPCCWWWRSLKTTTSFRGQMFTDGRAKRRASATCSNCLSSTRRGQPLSQEEDEAPLSFSLSLSLCLSFDRFLYIQKKNPFRKHFSYFLKSKSIGKMRFRSEILYPPLFSHESPLEARAWIVIPFHLRTRCNIIPGTIYFYSINS